MEGGRLQNSQPATAEVFARLPPPLPDDEALRESIRAMRADGLLLGVLDDDPTGSQAVHDVQAVTVLEEDAYEAALAGTAGTCFVLTNTRSCGTATTEGPRASSSRATPLLPAAASGLSSHSPGRVCTPMPSGRVVQDWLISAGSCTTWVRSPSIWRTRESRRRCEAVATASTAMVSSSTTTPAERSVSTASTPLSRPGVAHPSEG